MDKLFTDHPEWIKSKMLIYAHPRLDCLHPELDLEINYLYGVDKRRKQTEVFISLMEKTFNGTDIITILKNCINVVRYANTYPLFWTAEDNNGKTFHSIFAQHSLYAINQITINAIERYKSTLYKFETYNMVYYYKDILNKELYEMIKIVDLLQKKIEPPSTQLS